MVLVISRLSSSWQGTRAGSNFSSNSAWLSLQTYPRKPLLNLDQFVLWIWDLRLRVFLKLWFYLSRFLSRSNEIIHIKIKGRIIVTLHINLKKFILIDSVKMYNGIHIYPEMIIMACVLHQPLTWICALIISHDLLNHIGVTIISTSIFKGEN